MPTRIAAMLAFLLACNASLAAAQGRAQERSALRAMAAAAARPAGPLFSAVADLSRADLRAGTRFAARSHQDERRDDRSWIARHPVWTGVLIGFGAGFGLTFASGTDGIPGPTGPALIYGGLGAGLGALTGWGIGREMDDDYHNVSRAPSSFR